jgi:hypothetical protein
MVEDQICPKRQQLRPKDSMRTEDSEFSRFLHLMDAFPRFEKINEEHFRLELFKLMFYTLGDEVYCQLAKQNPDCSFADLHSDFYLDEIISLLISTAVKGRIYDETHSFIFDSLGGECGILQLESGGTTKLTLRTAFNKILHAKQHIWERDDDLASRHGVHLYGSYKGERWFARLDIPKYVHYCTMATYTPKDEIYKKQHQESCAIVERFRSSEKA